jgi:flagellar biosynthetic protein FlhB
VEETEQDRTEQPTAFKLMRARQKGSVARGADLGFTAALAAFFAAMWIIGTTFGVRLAKAARDAMITGFQLADGDGVVLSVVGQLFSALLMPMAFLAAVVFAVVLLFEILQAGIVFSADPLKPDFSRLNPAKGIKRLFSLRMLFETFKNVLKLAVYSIVGWLVIRSVLKTDIGGVADAHGLLALMNKVAIKLLAVFLLAAIAFAVLDQLIVRRDFLKRMRMSRRELRREHRDREGEPRLKQKRKQMHAEFIKLSQSIRGLRGADVLIVNPRHIALALRYDPHRMAAPVVVSIGTDRVAQRLKRLAFLYGIPVIEDRPLARELLRTSALNKPVPEHHYRAVAKIYNGLPRKHQP